MGAGPAAGMPLSDLLVIDLTRARSGPTCVRQLADWGADVIKIEPPPSSGVQATITGGRLGFDFQNLHRNKRSLTLDLKAPEGRQVLLDLAKTADVSSKTSARWSSSGWGSTTRRCARSIRGSSTAASPGSGRAAPTATGPASTRSRRASAASCR